MIRQRWASLCYLAAVWATAAAPAFAQQESPADAVSQYRSAVALQNREMYDLASEEWQAFVQDHPRDPLVAKAHHYLGVCLFQQGKFTAAESAFEDAVESQSDAKQVADSTLNLGLAQFNRGHAGDKQAMGRAIRTFEELAERFANSKEAREAPFYLAEAHYALGNLDEAAAAYQRALPGASGKKRRADILFGYGVTLQDLGRHQRARLTFEKLLQQAPDSDMALEARLRRADAMLESKDYQAAASEFRKLAGEREFPFADYVQMRLAACLYAQQSYRDAAQAYAVVTERFPRSEYRADATLATGKAFYLAKSPNEATPWLERAVKLGGNQAVEATHWLARCEIKSGHPEQALAIIESALASAKGPLAIDLRLDQADAVYEIRGRREEASQLYARLAQAHPDHESAPHALYMAAYAAVDAKRYQQALSHAEQFHQRYADHDLRVDVMTLEAESELQQENYAAAQQLYKKLLQRYDGHQNASLWRVRGALCLNLQNKHSEVVRTLKGHASSIRDPDLQSEALFLLGAAHYHEDRKTQAITDLRKSLAAAPTAPQADRTFLLLAKALRDRGKREEALNRLTKLVSLFPKSELLDRALLEQAELYAEAGKHKQAAATYEKLLDSFSDSDVAIDAIYGWGWSLLQAEEYASAIAVFDKLIGMQVKHRRVADAYYGRAVARQQLGKIDGALRDVEKYLTSRPSDSGSLADAYYLQGLCLAGKQRFTDAADSFERALRTAPDYADADQVMYEWAWALDSGKQPTKAATMFRELAERFPSSRLAAEALYRAAESDFEAKKYERAAAGFQTALQGAKKSELRQQSAHKLGWCFYHLEKFENAHRAFEKQLSQFSEGVLAGDAALMIGECLYVQDRFQESLAAYRSAGTAVEDSTNEQLAALSLLHAGQSAAKLQQWQTSLDYLQKLVSAYPNSDYVNEALYETAWAFQKSGDTQKAEKLYAQVADNSDSVVGARARFMLGELQFMREDYATAIRTFFKVAYGYGHPQAPQPYHRWQANAMFEAARCCESTKRFDAARRLYKDLIEFHPDSDKAQGARAKLETLATR